MTKTLLALALLFTTVGCGRTPLTLDVNTSSSAGAEGVAGAPGAAGVSGAAGSTGTAGTTAMVVPGWSNRTPAQVPASWPSGRRNVAMAFDPTTKRTVMYGGYASSTPALDTWEWNGVAGTWKDRAATPPAVFDDFAFTYDSTRGSLFLFGGQTFPNGGSSADLWEWNGLAGTWTLRLPRAAPNERPSATNNAVAAYDPARQLVVIHWASSVPGFDPLTWEWDPAAEAWDLRILPVAPRSSYHSAFAWDAARGKGVYFGGETRAELWEMTLDWTRIQHVGGAKWPAPRIFPSMAYDAARGRVLLFGGSMAGYFDDLWEWDGERGVWTELEADPSLPRPPGREWAGMAWDSDRSCLVLFGGANATGDLMDVWEWRRRP